MIKPVKIMEKKQKNSRASVTTLNVKEANFLLKRGDRLGAGAGQRENHRKPRYVTWKKHA